MTHESHEPFAELKGRDLEECVYWLLDGMGTKDLDWRTEAEAVVRRTADETLKRTSIQLQVTANSSGKIGELNARAVPARSNPTN